MEIPIEIRLAEKDIIQYTVDDFVRIHADFICYSFGVRSITAKLERSVYSCQGDIVVINARFHNYRSITAQPYVYLLQKQRCDFEILKQKFKKSSFRKFKLTPQADLSPIKPLNDRVWNHTICNLPAVLPSFGDDDDDDDDNDNDGDEGKNLEKSAISVEYWIVIGIDNRHNVFQNPVAKLPIRMAGSRAMPNDRVHRYATGRKRGIQMATLSTELPNAHSNMSFLSIISEAHSEGSTTQH